MRQETAVDGFRLAYERIGPGPGKPAVLYRAGAGSVAASLAEGAPGPGQRIAAPTTVLWPEHDPLFPREWSDRIGEFFAAATLTWLDDVGHFSPVEAPDAYAAAITAALAS